MKVSNTKNLHLFSGGGFCLAALIFFFLGQQPALGALFLLLGTSQFALASKKTSR